MKRVTVTVPVRIELDEDGVHCGWNCEGWRCGYCYVFRIKNGNPRALRNDGYKYGTRVRCKQCKEATES